MRNIKLLLATTAMLSMGAMVANATGIVGNETVDMPVKVDLITPISLTVDQPLDFGRIVVKDTLMMTLSMNSDGITTITSQTSPMDAQSNTHPGSSYILQPGGVGIISGTTCANISLPDSPSTISISDPNSECSGQSCSLLITQLKCDTVNGKSYISGGMSISGYSSSKPIPSGNYRGSFTVTAVYDERPQEE